jgi:alanyl-tRNA synthetase
MMTSDEIRNAFTSHFEGVGHHRLASASLVPANHDPSVLLTTAGMHPLKPYFLGLEEPPATTLTSCQKCFRTTDIENVGTTARHLTFFEMLGNFSIGEYFKEGAIGHAWSLATGAFGFKSEQIWITVFAGDDELGLGADEEAIEAWLAVGVERSRIVALGREDNFWQAGPTGPCGPCSELYLDRGPEFGPDDERPGDDGERYLEFWNLVFMQYEQGADSSLTPLPAKNIDTGMGLNRMAAILQGVGSVFDTDQFVPLMNLGRELATEEVNERSLRILADHSRAMCFLVADGVVPSNEERGYILRRLMRRAILHGRRLGMEQGFLVKYADVVQATMASNYPELIEQHDPIRSWLASEEEGFGRTLEAGTELLNGLIAAAQSEGSENISAEDAFRLHDTHGFPIDLTLELVAEHGLGVDEAGFETLMDAQRERARGGAAEPGSGGGGRTAASAAADFAKASEAAQTDFVGYGQLSLATTVADFEQAGESTAFVKLAESPFYAAGGGQVSDHGQLVIGGTTLTVVDVVRVGSDQVLIVEGKVSELLNGADVIATVGRSDRLAIQANHTATHLLHAALRNRLGSHVRQAGSSVGPDKLRFDFTHGEALSPADMAAVEDEVNARVLAGDPVGWRETSLVEAKALGAMALFGEKYGDVVRLVEVGDGEFSRELCGGTHVSNTAEIGCFRITSEGSSAANVRRIEAVSGPVAIELLRRHDASLRQAASTLRTSPEDVPAAIAKREARLKELEREARSGGGVDVDSIVAAAVDVAGVAFSATVLESFDPKGLPDLADRVRGRLGDDSVVVLAGVADGRVDLVVASGPGAIAKGIKAGNVVRPAAEAVGGGGGGRDNMARAGGKDPSAVESAIRAARSAVEAVLA